MNKHYLFKAVCLAAAVFGSAMAMASTDTGVQDTCTFPRLVLNIAPAFTGSFGTENTSVCIDVPVALNKTKNVFNLDINTKDGGGNSVGLKHIYMLGWALKDRIDSGLVNPDQVSIIGVMHGTAAAWALKTPGAATATCDDACRADRNKQHHWMDEIAKLKQAGINIQLEICGVTMRGSNWTNDMLYQPDNGGGKIYVNQGAIGRIIDLQQNGYVYIHEGYEDRD
jgi:intracellular sulfur oxidation DsrE/DsrF family protein